jgi:hypothetical protein
MILGIVVGRVRIGTAGVLTTIITHLIRLHLLVEQHLKRVVVVVLLGLWQVRPQVVAVNYSEQCLEFVFDELRQFCVADAWAAECVQLCGQFW